MTADGSVKTYVVANDVYAFGTYCHQGLYSIVEEVGVKCLLPGGDSILLVYICCKLHAGCCFLRGPKSLRSQGPILPTRHHW